MSLTTAAIDLYSGVSASSATGLPIEFRDPGLFGFHVGLSQLLYSAELRRQELNNCLAGRYLYSGRREQWWSLELRRDLMLPPNACSVCPDACAGSYGFLHPAPDGLTDCAVVQSSVIAPDVTMDACVNVIYDAEGGSFFHFAVDPFTLPFPTRDKKINGNTTQVIDAWMHLAVFESQYTRRYLSPLSGLNQTVPDAVHEAFMHCLSVPSILSFLQLVGEITQSPVCTKPAVVTDLLLADDYRSSTVVTTDGTYSAGRFVVPVVSVGQAVIPGDQLFDGFYLSELSHQRPTWTDQLRIPGTVLSIPGVDYLDLAMDEVPVVVESSTRVTFDVGDHSDAYWDYLYSRDQSLTTSLRGSLIGMSSVSPYEFFRAQRLLYGVVALQLRGETMEETASVVPLLRQLLPPQRMLLLTITGQVPPVLQDRLSPCCII